MEEGKHSAVNLLAVLLSILMTGVDCDDGIVSVITELQTPGCLASSCRIAAGARKQECDRSGDLSKRVAPGRRTTNADDAAAPRSA
jgi:hypothetical protein